MTQKCPATKGWLRIWAKSNGLESSGGPRGPPSSRAVVLQGATCYERYDTPGLVVEPKSPC
jgi:hypothetical protein